jgi:Xaa-Pro aminopeptidase
VSGPGNGTGPATERFADRLSAARTLAVEAGLDALLVGVGPDLRYLTGYDAIPLERLTMLVVPARGPIRLYAPRLEMTPARGCPAASAALLEVVPWGEQDDAHGLVAGFVREAVGEESSAGLRVAVSDTLWASHVLALQAALPGAAFGPASSVLRALRMTKDAEEIDQLRRAAHAADRVVAAIAAGRLVGRTEADVAREVRERLLGEGHEVASFAIVGSGPNSASPHHSASERVIAAGEPIVLDIGGTMGGYGSDITRTLWVTGSDPEIEPDAEFLRLFALVQEANFAATAAVRPGMPAEAIDAVARRIITGGGYGDQFTHRTGHGIGLEAHEDPYLVAGNGEPLEVGHAFSIEPGIYLDGRYGARIEDIVICGPDGPDVLNQQPRDLFVVRG